MNAGIQDAAELAIALADAILFEDLSGLDAYSGRRRPVAQRVIGLADRMTRAAAMKNPLAKSLRNMALQLVGHLPPVRRSIAASLAELSRC